jgi:hypothetical protein
MIYIVIVFGIKTIAGILALINNKEWPLEMPLKFTKKTYSLGVLENALFAIVAGIILIF